MQCPKCQMNINDGSKYCIHCGTHFDNISVAPVQSIGTTCPKCNQVLEPGAQFCPNCGNQVVAQSSVATNTSMPTASANATMTPQQVLQQNQQNLSNERNEREKYLKAYFGSKYNRVMRSNFSLGTFFFEWIWLLIHKLYGAAGKLFVIQIGINIAANVIAIFLGRTIGSLLGTIVNIYVVFMYAKSFPSAYINRANCDIDEILKKYQTEEERLKACKAAGRPSIIGIIIILSIISLFVFLIISAFKTAGDSMDNSRKDTFADTSKLYINEVRNAVLMNELNCGSRIDDVEPGIYYYGFTTANGLSAENLAGLKLKSPWNNADVAGQVIIHKQNMAGQISYKYAIVLVDEKGRGIGEFDNNGKVLSAVSESSIRRIVIKTSNDDNRQVYFNKASVGTPEAFSSVGPTLDTKIDYTPLVNLSANGTENITKEPVACELTR